MLIRAGFLHQVNSTSNIIELLVHAHCLTSQSQPGIFHMLPMGHRVQAKIENLLDKHMLGLGVYDKR